MKLIEVDIPFMPERKCYTLMQLHKSCTWIETARLYLTEAVCFSDSARTFSEDVLDKELRSR